MVAYIETWANLMWVQVCYCGSGEQDVLCINERQVIVRSKAMYEQPNVSTEGIYSDLSNRLAILYHTAVFR